MTLVCAMSAQLEGIARALNKSINCAPLESCNGGGKPEPSPTGAERRLLCLQWAPRSADATNLCRCPLRSHFDRPRALPGHPQIAADVDASVCSTREQLGCAKYQRQPDGNAVMQ